MVVTTIRGDLAIKMVAMKRRSARMVRKALHLMQKQKIEDGDVLRQFSFLLSDVITLIQIWIVLSIFFWFKAF